MHVMSSCGDGLRLPFGLYNYPCVMLYSSSCVTKCERIPFSVTIDKTETADALKSMVWKTGARRWPSFLLPTLTLYRIDVAQPRPR